MKVVDSKCGLKFTDGVCDLGAMVSSFLLELGQHLNYLRSKF